MLAWGFPVTFNPTIDLGSLVTLFGIVVGWIVGALIFVMALRHSMDALGTRVTSIETQLAAVASTMSDIAVQDNRIKTLEKMVDELRHGEGMVLPIRRGSREVP